MILANAIGWAGAVALPTAYALLVTEPVTEPCGTSCSAVDSNSR